MKFLRTVSLIALAVALSVGVFVSDAQAAVLDSVRVVKPDSGVVRGIDSVIVAQVFFRSTSADSSIATYLWLASKANKTVALEDGTNSVIEDSVALAVNNAGLPVGSSFVAARAPLKKGYFLTAGGAMDPTKVGDADSVAIKVGPAVDAGKSWIVEFYYKVDPTVGEVDNVAVWAVVWDINGSSSTHFSDIKGSTWATKIYGDRPSHQTLALNAVGQKGGSEVFGFTTAPATKTVLGIGDTVKIEYDLGTAGDEIILLSNLTMSAQLDYGTPKTIPLGKIRNRVDSAFVVIENEMFPNMSETSGYGQVSIFLTDVAGNLSSSGPDDVVPTGLTKAAEFVIDAKKPVLDGGVTAGDTILPVSNDSITDGGVRLGTAYVYDGIDYYPDDLNPIKYNLGEDLRKLTIAFDNADTNKNRSYSIAVDPAALEFGGAQLAGGLTKTLDLTKGSAAYPLVFRVIAGGTQAGDPVESADSALTTGTYTVKFTGVDLAGNTGPTLTRTNVYVDVTDITLGSLFPTAALDTIEEVTSRVRFALSEPADSVVIRYRKLSGADPAPVRTRRLAGAELTTLTPQLFPFADSLRNLTNYELTVLARDLAGNVSMSGPDTFLYDTSFVVPMITRFVVVASKSGLGSPAIAGDAITLTIRADASTNDSRAAVTYESDAILRVAGGSGVTLAGTAVTDGGGGRAVLGGAGWVAGQRTVTLKDTSSVDTLAVSVVDSSDATSPYVGVLDSTIVYNPHTYAKIFVSAPASVTQGEAFTVDVKLADKYGNQRVADNRYMKVSTNKVGVESQQGEVLISKGAGSFQVVANGFTGDGLIVSVADLLVMNNAGTGPAAGSSAAITVAPSGAPPVDPGIALDAPDTLIAQDYMGADGLGDQGGFVLLTWELSSDHGILTGYRIYREMMVDYGVDAEGNVVMLDAPETDWVPWAKVDAVPGEVIGRAVVATLDNVATHWAIAAERGTSTTAKEAFDQDADMSTPYELMAATMVESKKAADLVDGVRIATLSPEALAFIENGVVPRMKSVDTEMVLSDLTPTVDAVRAIDNIAPAAVAVMRAKDTPNDAGSSITVTWTRSESDQMVQRSFPNAVGLHGVSDQVAGVMGYNVYRSVGDAAPALVGKAPSGASSFADETAINGVRYTYTVRPYDSDNEAPALVAQTSMAVRNNVFDEAGMRLYGLFGMDSVVGFDDFFLFADNFGMSAADEAFDAAFDLVPDAKVDFEDFFLFADSFGKVARVAGKVVPTVAGLNADARMYLDASAELPAIGEEVAVAVDLADYVELKGYGFSVQYDAEVLEFVGVKSSNSLLGEGELAAPRVIFQTDGEVAIAAYGETVSEGSLDVSLVFRTKTEIENTFVDVTESEVRDGNYAVNQLALPAPVQIQTRPEAFALRNNYPNPFNPSTTIKYALPEASFVQLQVYNVVGQVVRTLVADHQNAGRYVVQWDASDDSGHSLSSGIYFYRLQAGDQFLEVKKMLLLK